MPLFVTIVGLHEEQEQQAFADQEEECVSLNDMGDDGDDGDDDSFVGSDIYAESADGNASTTSTPEYYAAPLAPRETQAVKYVRVLVLTAMILTTVTVAVAISTADRYEEDAFELAVEEQALAIGNRWTSHLEQQLTALQALGVSMTSYSYSQSQSQSTTGNTSSPSSSWPLVTLPDFAQRAGPLASLVKGVMVLPLISDDTM
jgi:hypothetical protein